MHIPDGMISPSTALVANAAMLPVWLYAGKQTRDTLQQKQVPLLAICAAFSFTIMMFNVPALGGTTAHAVGSTLIAILLGPWAAIIAVTVALVIQAVFFADGGILAIGANCFAMAFVQPLIGYLVYKLALGRSTSQSRQLFAAGIGSYIAIAIASATVAILLGIQPTLFHDAVGRSLFFPFGLKVTLAGIVPTHLLIAGPIEALVTVVAVRFAVSNGIALLGQADAPTRKAARWEKFGLALFALLALSPFGLLATGEAWGEWDATKTEQLTGYVPKGISAQESHGWRGLGIFSDYASDKGPLFYILAGVIGVAAIAAVIFLLGLLFKRKALPGEDEKPIADLEPPREGLPHWLQTNDPSTPPPSTRQRSANRFAEKSLTGLTEGARSMLSSDQTAHLPGWLQSVDARVKVVLLIGLTIVAAWVNQWISLGVLFALGVILAIGSRLPIKSFLTRVWLTAPLMIGVVAIPATLNLVTPGKSILTLYSNPYISITDHGLNVAGILVFRVGVSLTFALLIASTTPWSDFLAALRSLGVPRLFVTVVAMSYRYLGTLLKTASEMLLARHSRSVGALPNGEGRKFVGRSVGALFGKSMRLSEDIHAAMVARGFQGDIRTLDPPRLRIVDGLWAVGMVTVGILAAFLNGMS